MRLPTLVRCANIKYGFLPLGGCINVTYVPCIILRAAEHAVHERVLLFVVVNLLRLICRADNNNNWLSAPKWRRLVTYRQFVVGVFSYSVARIWLFSNLLALARYVDGQQSLGGWPPILSIWPERGTFSLTKAWEEDRKQNGERTKQKMKRQR